MRRPIVLLVALAALLSLGIAACGSSGSSSAGASGSGGAATHAPSTKNMIVIKNFMFAPMTLTVSPGATVSVRNDDSVAHTVTASKNEFNTGDIAQNATKTFTAPTKPGTYTYICNIHQYMQGTLTVK